MPDSRSAARAMLFAVLGTLVLLPLACHSARAGEEIARVAVDRPAVVVIERMDDGGLRVILEYHPRDDGDDPGPTPPSTPTPRTMAEVVDRAISRLPAEYREAILAEFADVLAAANNAHAAGLLDSVEVAYGFLSTATIHALDQRPDRLGTAHAGAIAELAGALQAGAKGTGLGVRLAELKRIVEARRK